jgi:Pyruvate/2-oxoacid:ferredoxin oxidoreductase gamma subunit
MKLKMKKMIEIDEIKSDIRTVGNSIVIGLVVVMITMIAQEQVNHDETMKKLDLIEKKMEIMLKDRNALDEAYKEHLKECAFISKDEVKVDGMGYFYSSYRRAGR